MSNTLTHDFASRWTGATRLLMTALIALTAFMQAAHADDYVIYVHTDHLGNPIAYTNEQGVVIEREYYLPYGQTLNENNTLDDDSAGFTGHVSDSDTGLVYMQARYYDPVAGRFLSTDPVTFSPDKPNHFNRYWYTAGSPLQNIDPDGRAPWGMNQLMIQNNSQLARDYGRSQGVNDRISQASAAASYPARQVTLNGAAAGTAASSFLLGPEMLLISTAISSVAMIDKNNVEGLTTEDKVLGAIGLAPAGAIAKQANAADDVVKLINSGSAAVAVSANAASAAPHLVKESEGEKDSDAEKTSSETRNLDD